MVSERFLALPEAKQRSIINAGFQVFGQHEYKRASTEEIARLAGISKGYLFYYFHNKKELYLYLYETAINLSCEIMDDPRFQTISDFFELMEYTAEKKAAMAARYPFLTPFILRALYDGSEELRPELNRKILHDLQMAKADGLRNIDFSKFKSEVDPAYLVHLMQWAGEGYILELQRSKKKITVEAIMPQARQMLAFFKKMTYREEYQ